MPPYVCVRSKQGRFLARGNRACDSLLNTRVLSTRVQRTPVRRLAPEHGRINPRTIGKGKGGGGLALLRKVRLVTRLWLASSAYARMLARSDDVLMHSCFGDESVHGFVRAHETTHGPQH